MDEEEITVPTLKPSRVYMQFAGFPTLRMQPHKDDANLVVAKCKNPEGIDMALRVALLDNGHAKDKVSEQIGLLILERFQGKQYAIAVITHDTAAMLASWAAEVMVKPAPPPAVEVEPLSEYDEDAAEDLDV
jgi:hypothetical protein